MIVPPTHTGLLLPAVGVAGIGFTTTDVDPSRLGQPDIVTVTLYAPAIATVAFVIEGFCVVLVKLFGPVHQ